METTAHRSRAVLWVVGTGTFLSALASSSVSLALPSLGGDLTASLETSRWVILAYLLTVTALLPVAGRAGDLLGLRWVYLGGFSLFGLASLGCACSPTLAILVAARLLQGVGGAMILATSPALLTTTFPGAEWGKALGLQSMATYAGLTVGPPLGGWILDVLGWRWIFGLNIPVACLVVTLGWSFLPRGRDRAGHVLDWEGLVLLLLGLPLLLLSIGGGPSLGGRWWTSCSLALAGVLLLLAFIRIELCHPQPLLQPRLFRSRLFSGAVLSALCNYFGLFIPQVLLPFLLAEGLMVSPTTTGLVLATQPLVMALVAAPAGWLSDRLGSRWLATSGMLVMAAGLLGMSTLGPRTGIGTVVLWQVLVGLGTGTFISPNSNALMGAAPRDQQGVAGGVMAVARNLGMLIGVATATAMFQASGARTGAAWGEAEYNGLDAAMKVAATVVWLGAFLAALRGKEDHRP